jgi:hypothetical protein
MDPAGSVEFGALLDELYCRYPWNPTKVCVEGFVAVVLALLNF